MDRNILHKPILPFYIPDYIFVDFVGRPTERNFRSSTQKETFDGGRKDINAAIDQICEFTGKHFVLSVLACKL